MDKNKGDGRAEDAPSAPAEATKSIRHRFAEGETTVMPLADVLRNRERTAAQHTAFPQGDASERTQIAQAPAGFAARPVATPAGAGQKTQVAPLTAAQAALLTRTEPVAAQVRAAPTQARSAPPAPQPTPVRREPSARTTLASIQRAPGPDAQATQPASSPATGRVASVIDELVAEEIAALGEDVAAQAPRRVAPQPASAVPVEPRAGLRRRVANGCVVVFSCKGGAGATMLSLNTAYRTAKDDHSACIVDLDLQMGDALAALGLSPRYNIAQVTLAMQQGESFGKNLLPQHASGIAVLSQVGALDDIDRITPESMAALVQTVRQNYDVVVVDGVRDFSDNALAVLDVADKITVVTVQEVLAIRRARWAFGILRKIGFDPQDISIVVNRYNPQGDITLESIRAMFEPALVLTVPEDSRAVLQSLNRGVPLLEARKLGPVGHAVAGVWANAVYDEIPQDVTEQESQEAGRAPMWRRLFGRGRQNP